MNVGLLTYHTGTNYGGSLQCLALQTAVESLGHKVQVINYHPYPRKLALWKGWQLRHRGLAHVIPRIQQIRHGSGLLRKFDQFRENQLHLSAKVSTLAELKKLASSYDAIIAGSDQIWNFKAPAAYFLPLDDSFKGKKIGYATCCTQEQQPSERIETVGTWIQDFYSISVRDGFSKAAVENASGRTVEIVCDPTLLMSALWPLDETKRSPTTDIMVYRLGAPMDGDMQGFIDRLKQRLGVANVEAVVPAASNPIICREADSISYDTPPFEWAAKILNCKFLVTDSYHAVLFAIRYKVPFMAYYTCVGRAPRLIDLGERLGISDRIVGSAKDADIAMEHCMIPVSSFDVQSRDFIKDSWKFLEDALNR